jgi:hypothetical protein
VQVQPQWTAAVKKEEKEAMAVLCGRRWFIGQQQPRNGETGIG